MVKYKYTYMVEPAGVITIYYAKLIKERDDGLVLLQPTEAMGKIVTPKDEVFDALDAARRAVKKLKSNDPYFSSFIVREVIQNK